MSFWKASFSSFGEAMRTASLAIGLFATAISGVGYMYNVLSEQKAMAVEVGNHNERILKIEEEARNQPLWRFRVEQLERDVANINSKLDKILSTLMRMRSSDDGQ